MWLSIKNVAQQVGYLNASTFSSVFTTKVGLSPKAFRAEAA
ncbi:MAG: AraC family transcriptional regulator [Lachnospiraceae bacterium]|nr:AraC family transcriptional regulator [Lachnospiraceae bacterium]MCI9098848.1 AraC family transcriptional regulator [Lachnospiraceae bacterium]MCI9356645.1 AraC family transcriptional regulator [Lachnospiraceae bacterium]